MKNNRKRYSRLERKAYYTGMGVGFSGCSPTTGKITSRAFALMSDKEKASYMNGYERGLDNVNARVGCKSKHNWF